MQLYDREGHQIPIVSDRVVLEEYGTYFCALPGEDGGGVELLFGERVLERGVDGRFVVPVGPWAGALQLKLHRAGVLERSLHADVHPHASKLDPEAWASLLEDLDALVALAGPSRRNRGARLRRSKAHTLQSPKT